MLIHPSYFTMALAQCCQIISKINFAMPYFLTFVLFFGKNLPFKNMSQQPFYIPFQIFSCQGPTKCTKIANLGLEIYHLAPSSGAIIISFF